MASEIGLLIALIKTNHDSVMDRLDSIEGYFKEQRRFCDDRFDGVETDVKKHDRCMSKYKGMVYIIGALWGAIVAMVSLVAPIFWR